MRLALHLSRPIAEVEGWDDATLLTVLDLLDEEAEREGD